ncbi:hypothetical protein B0H10DRAFT_1655234, partial [Mycena sp. CBHHK59/15]
EKRAEWASLTIHRLSQNIRKAPVVKEEAKTHPLIQNYVLAKRDPPKLHKAMLKCMDKYGVIFETVSPTEDIQRALPLWHHPGEDPTKTQKNNGTKAHCLRTKHGVKTLGKGVDLAERLKKNAHEKTTDCSCGDCIEDRTERGCKNPHACATAAIDRMKQIRPKWTDRSTPTWAADPEDDVVLFVPPKNTTSLAQGLRALTKRSNEAKERPVPRIRRRAEVATPPSGIKIYVNSAIHAPPRLHKSAAAGVFYGMDDVRNKGFRIPAKEEQSPYAAEMYAALDAVRNTDTSTTL